MVAQSCHPRTCKAETRSSVQTQGQPDLQSEIQGISQGYAARNVQNTKQAEAGKMVPD